MLARILVSFACANVAAAQCPQYTPIFYGGGFDEQVEALLSFDDGGGAKLYAAGRFEGAGAAPAARIAVWNGSNWSAVGGGMSGAVNALAVHDDGAGSKLYAGGGFQQAGGAPAARVACWNGSSWSALGAGLSGGPVRVLRSFDDGSGAALYAGGGFDSSGATATAGIARWNGASWQQVGTGLTGAVRALAAHDDGGGAKLYATYDGGARVARWSGAAWQDISSTLGSGANVNALASYDAGPAQRWLVAGGGNMLGNGTGVALWDGAAWSALLNVGFTERVSALLVRQEGPELALYASGGSSVGHVRRWTPSTGWSTLIDDLSNGIPLALAFHDDGAGAGEQLFAAGQFTWLRPHSGDWLDVQRIARFHAGTWRQVMPPAPASPVPPKALGFPIGAYDRPEIRALARWIDPRDGRAKLAVGGGSFAPLPGADALGLALWDGLRWSALPQNPLSALYVDKLTTWLDPSVGAEVLLASGEQPGAVWTFDGANWRRLGLNAPPVSAFASYAAPGAAGPELYAASTFLSSATPGWLCRWNGATWSQVPGIHGAVRAMVVFDPPGALGEELYLFGQPTLLGGASTMAAARGDGTQWTALPSAGLTPGIALLSAAVFDDGTGPALFAGSTDDLWRFDGATWTRFPLSISFAAYDLEVFDDGTGPALYMGGGLRLRNGQVESYAPSFALPPSNGVFDLQAFADESGGARALFIGGDFEIAGVPARGLARWSNPCGALRSYCTAKVNSLGCTPAIGWSGEPSAALVSTAPFVITAANVLNQRQGLLYYGVVGALAAPFQGGVQCVRPPLRRTLLRSSGGNVGTNDCSGLYAIDFSSWIDGTNDLLVNIGTTVRAQWWSRDPASPSGTGLSDAIELEVRP
jgi:hypothetical protein